MYPYVTRPPGFWGPGYIINPENGPQTGVISGQANPGYATALDVPNYWGVQGLGWYAEEDVWNASLAQIYAFLRPGTGLEPLVDDFFKAYAQPMPMPQPRYDEWPAPWHQQPHRRHTPAAKPPPARAPTFPEPFPVRPPVPARAPRPSFNPLRAPRPNERDNAFSRETSKAPNKPPQNKPGPPRHTKRPPKANEREKKGKWAQAGTDALNAFGAATEGMDFMDAAWKALPKSAKSKSFHAGKYVKPSWHKRAKDVWNGYDKIDLDKFAKNLVSNQLEDLFGGLQAKGMNPQRRLGAQLGRKHLENTNPRDDPPLVNFDKMVDQAWPDWLSRQLRRKTRT